MAYLSYFGIENFRVFKEQTNFEFAPISVLTGTNSSGKSSIIKALLLLQDNFNGQLFSKLKFDGKNHNLGVFNNVLNYNKKSDVMHFWFPIPDVFYKKWTIHYYFKKAENVKVEYGELKSIIIRSNDKKIVLLELTKSKNQNQFDSDKDWYNNQEDNDEYLLTINFKFIFDFYKNNKIADLEKKIRKNDINYDIDKLGYFSDEFKYFIDEEELFIDYSFQYDFNSDTMKKIYKKLKEIEKMTVIEFYNKCELPFWLVEWDLGIETIDSKDDFWDLLIKNIEKAGLKKFIDVDYTQMGRVNGNLYPMINNFIMLFKYLSFNFLYLPSIRGNIQRLYKNFSDEIILNKLFIEFNNRNFKIDSKEIEFLSKWLKKFQISDFLIIDRIEGTTSVPYLIKNNNKVLLADLGFGITQILPVLLMIILKKSRIDLRDQ